MQDEFKRKLEDAATDGTTLEGAVPTKKDLDALKIIRVNTAGQSTCRL